MTPRRPLTGKQERRRGSRVGFALALSATVTAGCFGGEDPARGSGDFVAFTVPQAASFQEVTDTLSARGLVDHPFLFRGFARVRGDDRQVRSGTYRVPAEIGWTSLLETLTEGRVVTVPVTIPEGFTLEEIAPRIADVTGEDEEEVRRRLEADDAHEAWDLPGPGLEGYLFPDTYRFAPGVSVDSLLRALIERYRAFWTEERRGRAEELGMSELEIVTLASIVEAEARHSAEMDTISSVYHNRLRIGMPLQADPTVQYALGERRSRLLYSHIDEVEDHPYNTYTNPGLPPGPIGAPGEEALRAALEPADTPYLYFVARPDGSHIFSRTLAEHNRARVEARREWERAGPPLLR